VLLSHNVPSYPSNADSDSYIRAPHMLHLAYNICAGCLSQQGYFCIQLCIPACKFMVYEKSDWFHKCKINHNTKLQPVWGHQNA